MLITGATGYIARHLIPLLSANPTVSKIHCVAMRKPPPTTIYRSDKLVHYNGDLSAPLLGLTQIEFHALAAEVDMILHLGAARTF